MKIRRIHRWDVTPREAIQIQEKLKSMLSFKLINRTIRLVAGADVSVSRFEKKLFACVVILDLPSLKVREFACAASKAAFPYVPGLLSFREIPPVIKALKKIKTVPDVLICDGQGYAHPRRMGLASHLGLMLDIPTVGCAKSCLIGEFKEPGKKRKSSSWLFDKAETIGAVLRTKDNVKPLFVSVGNNIDLKSSIDIVLTCCEGYRLPETIRQAHHLVTQYREKRALQPL